jgi:UDP-GlcNAc:undecaprenyl-phosphate GlcNAc-1-phosphate transferase
MNFTHPDLDRAAPGLIAGFLLAFALVMVVTPAVRGFMRAHGIVDRPDARRVNKRAIARGGGIAVALGFLVVSLLMLAINAVFHFVEAPNGIGPVPMAALLAGGALAAAVGMLDDLYQLRARYQFVGQFVVAFFAVAAGIEVKATNIPLIPDGTFNSVPVLGILATVVWIVALINSINFIDGLDGLSSGIALIAALTLGVFSLGIGSDEPFVALFCLILAGALAGFLRWNFHPASIFAGTSGIMFVGYTLAVLSILGAAKVAVALLVLGVPIMDTFWITVRRVASGRSPFAADRGHIHHRLLDLGLSHRDTVLVIYGVCVLLAALSLVVSVTVQTYAFLGLVVLFGLALLLSERLGPGGAAIGESLDASSYSPGEPSAEAGGEAQPSEAAPVPARTSALASARAPATSASREDAAAHPQAPDPW